MFYVSYIYSLNVGNSFTTEIGAPTLLLHLQQNVQLITPHILVHDTFLQTTTTKLWQEKGNAYKRTSPSSDKTVWNSMQIGYYFLKQIYLLKVPQTRLMGHV